MIEDLRLLELHDTPIRSLQIDFEKEELFFIISPYDEKLNDYVNLELRFLKISHFSVDHISDIRIAEIFSVEYLDVEFESYRVEFLLVYDYPTKNIQLTFHCKDLNVKRISLDGNYL